MSTTASLAAYAAIVEKLPQKCRTVYSLIQAHWDHPTAPPGATIDECMRALGWKYSTTSARIFELAEAGLIKDSGYTRMGQTVWIASAPEEVDGLKVARKAAKKFEAIVTHVSHGEEHPGQPVEVTFRIIAPVEKAWEFHDRLQRRKLRVRFI